VAAIDVAQDPAAALRVFGPLLLGALTELRATPMSRKAARPVPGQPSRLDQLRSVRARSGRPGEV
jgi:hypothetical protein